MNLFFSKKELFRLMWFFLQTQKKEAETSWYFSPAQHSVLISKSKLVAPYFCHFHYFTSEESTPWIFCSTLFSYSIDNSDEDWTEVKLECLTLQGPWHSYWKQWPALIYIIMLFWIFHLLPVPVPPSMNKIHFPLQSLGSRQGHQSFAMDRESYS